MKRLRTFAYHEPSTVADAIAILVAEGDGARVLAGGTDLVVDMKTNRMRPSAVVNLKRIAGLEGIEIVPGGIRIGALTRATAIERSPLIRQRHRVLAEAASVLASPPVRAMATIGGNVGRASPASDLGPALIVEKATATIAGRTGTRDEPVEELYVGPGVTTLVPSDIITSFFLPDPLPGAGSAHAKLGKRGSGTDIALAGASASVAIGARGEIVECRVALASLGPTPLRARATEDVLIGEIPTEAVLVAAADTARREARPIGDMRASAGYRTTLARVLTLRALRAALPSAAGAVTA